MFALASQVLQPCRDKNEGSNLGATWLNCCTHAARAKDSSICLKVHKGQRDRAENQDYSSLECHMYIGNPCPYELPEGLPRSITRDARQTTMGLANLKLVLRERRTPPARPSQDPSPRKESRALRA